ncbi:MAG: hypothetical protein HYV03_00650, partial [Deltaproteobacteria bacterium]|nr:hypothetical protein [Deltaproteobacteria bacterium]
SRGGGGAGRERDAAAAQLVSDPPRLPDGTLDPKRLGEIAKAALRVVKGVLSGPAGAGRGLYDQVESLVPLLLLRRGVPQGLINATYLKDRVFYYGLDTFKRLQSLLLDPATHRVAALIEEIGLSRFFKLIRRTEKKYWYISKAGWIVASAAYVNRTIGKGYRTAGRMAYPIGPRIEFVPSGVVRWPGIIKYKDDTRDEVCERIARYYEKRRLEDGRRRFEVRRVNHGGVFIPVPGAPLMTQMIEYFEYGPKVTAERIQDGDAVRVMVYYHESGNVRTFRAVENTISGSEREVYRSVRDGIRYTDVKIVYDIIDSSRSDTPMAQYWSKLIVVLPDANGDMAKVEIVLDNGKARLKGLNVDFRFPSGEVKNEETLLAASYKDAVDGLAGLLDRGVQLLRRDLIAALDISEERRGGRITLRLELDYATQHPFMALVARDMTPGQFPLFLPAVRALAARRYRGTTRKSPVGTSFVLSLPATVQTSDGVEVYSVAPFLSLLRAYVAEKGRMRNTFPMSRERWMWQTILPSDTEELLADPNYITDPTDPSQILRLAADLFKRGEISSIGLNCEGFFAYLLRRFLKDDIFGTTSGEFVYIWEGNVYKFRTEIDKTNDRYEIYLVTDKGERSLTRVPRWKERPVVELALFDTVNDNSYESFPRIDPPSFNFALKFAASWGYLNGVKPFEKKP